jgi:hypothetical protein
VESIKEQPSKKVIMQLRWALKNVLAKIDEFLLVELAIHENELRQKGDKEGIKEISHTTEVLKDVRGQLERIVKELEGGRKDFQESIKGKIRN